MHHNPLRVHKDDSHFVRASRAGLTQMQIRGEEYAFTVLRNPVDRFFSLYTDKVVGEGHLRYVPLRRVLETKYGLRTGSLSVEDHTRNCEILIGWIGENLSSGKDMPKEAHWKPQSYREEIIREFDLKILLVGDLNHQLSVLLQQVVPDIRKVLSSLERNRSIRPFPKGQILNRSLRKRINEVYSRDKELFEMSKAAWSSVYSKESAQTAPRYSDLTPKP